MAQIFIRLSTQPSRNVEKIKNRTLLCVLFSVCLWLRSACAGGCLAGNEGGDQIADSIRHQGGAEDHNGQLSHMEGIDHQQNSQSNGDQGGEAPQSRA